MARDRRSSVSRRELFGSILRPKGASDQPDPEPAELSVHPKERVQELLARLQNQNARSTGEENE